MNRFKAVLAITALWTSAALAQQTLQSTVYFPTGQNVLRVHSTEGYLGWKNSIGNVALFTTLNANRDSLQEQQWSVVVTRQLSLPQHRYEVIVTGMPFDPLQTIIYKDTIDLGATGAQFAVPDRNTRQTVGNSPFPFSQDSIFSIWVREDTLYNGDKTEILFTRFVPVAGSTTGEINSIPADFFDTLTVADDDTMSGTNDTTYTRAFPVVRNANVGVFIDMVPITGTGDTLALALQFKRNGSNSWYGGPGGKVRVLQSVVAFNDSTYALTIPADSLMVADSVRVAQISLVDKGRNIIKRFFVKYFSK